MEDKKVNKSRRSKRKEAIKAWKKMWKSMENKGVAEEFERRATAIAPNGMKLTSFDKFQGRILWLNKRKGWKSQ
jgi:hypothetical protein